MSKAILVLDMPNHCNDCKMYEGFPDHRYREIECWCNAAYKTIRYITEDELRNKIHKPDWCPLKLIPDRIEHSIYDYDADTGYTCGWNDCIDTLIRE